MSLVLTVFLSISIRSQEVTDFINDYYRISVQGNYLSFKAGETNSFKDPIVSYTITKSPGALYGIGINVWNTKHWNFKTGFLLKYNEIAEHYFFPKEQSQYPIDIGYSTRFSDYGKIITIPINVEYIFSISKNIKPYLTSGFSIGYYREYGGSGLEGLGGALIENIYDDMSDKPFYSNFEVGGGFYFPLKHLMIQAQFAYSKSFTNILEGSYTVSNIVGQDYTSTTGTLSQSGDYWAVGLSFYFKKRGKNK